MRGIEGVKKSLEAIFARTSHQARVGAPTESIRAGDAARMGSPSRVLRARRE